MTDITRPYTLHPIEPVGAEVRGLQLCQPQSEDTVKKLKADVIRYKVLIVKDQGVLSGEKQLEISQWFGELELPGYVHEKSPDEYILRVSNDESQGFRAFGTAGIHIDGTFLKCPYPYAIYHIIHVPEKGETFFMSLNDVYTSMSDEQRELLDRLWIVRNSTRDDPRYAIQPLVYNHPVTGNQILCLHLGETSEFILDKGARTEETLSENKTKEILQDIYDAIRRDDDRLIYKHKWEAGDLILSDNLAVGHLAGPGTQLPREEVGLRVMHRIVVKGTYRPQKSPGKI